MRTLLFVGLCCLMWGKVGYAYSPKQIEHYVKRTVPAVSKWGYGNCIERARVAEAMAEADGYEVSPLYWQKGETRHMYLRLEKGGRTWEILR